MSTVALACPADDALTLLNSRETARRLGISERTLWNLVDGGQIRTVRIGRLVKYDPRDVAAFIERSKVVDSPYAE